MINDTQTIAKGQYNIRSNWVHITAENELFESIENDLRDAIEDRDSMLTSRLTEEDLISETLSNQSLNQIKFNF